MTMKNVNGVDVPLTPDEEAEYIARQEAWILPEAIRARTVPQTVTMRQARLALLQAGLLDAVTAAVQQAGQAVQIEWEYATDVRRASPLVQAISAGMGLTEAQVDALFIAGAKL